MVYPTPLDTRLDYMTMVLRAAREAESGVNRDRVSSFTFKYHGTPRIINVDFQ
jgi:hypothetical protein